MRVLFAAWLRSRSSHSSILHASAANIEFIRIPQRVGVEYGGLEIADARIGARQDVRRGEENKRYIFRDELLHAVVHLLAFCIVKRDHLLLHQPVDLALPI